jgi:outer membrane protein OmpA-like peptidoglycan-associated protein
MNAKKLIAILAMAMLWSASADAQGWLNKVKDKAVNTVKDKVSNKVERVVGQAADEVLDGKSSNKQSKNSNTSSEADYEDVEVEGIDDTPDADTQNQKNDFVRGSVILFQDDFAGEQMGEFPSKWDISEGSVETASVNGKKYLHSNAPYSKFSPLMENMRSYLPEVFTLEWDEFFCKQGEIADFPSDFVFNDAEGGDICNIYKNYRPNNPDFYGNYGFKKGGGVDESVSGNFDWDQMKKYIKVGQWNHFAISFNKRAFKFYVNGNRFINLPNVAAPARFAFIVHGENPYRGIANVVLAKGGVDLYERKTTDLSAVEKAIAETGKFVTNNILFETGKATLKAESMDEIQKVAEYMKKNPTVRFEVQGHTDNQGSDKINDPLSQQRAEAVVKALEGLGVDGFNLRAVGKGSHEPVADNATEAGRAQNRRVVFVKK